MNINVFLTKVVTSFEISAKKIIRREYDSMNILNDTMTCRGGGSLVEVFCVKYHFKNSTNQLRDTSGPYTLVGRGKCRIFVLSKLSKIWIFKSCIWKWLFLCYLNLTSPQLNFASVGPDRAQQRDCSRRGWWRRGQGHWRKPLGRRCQVRHRGRGSGPGGPLRARRWVSSGSSSFSHFLGPI